MVLSIPVLLAAVISGAQKNDRYHRTIELSLPDSSIALESSPTNESSYHHPDYEYVIQRGDSLSKIFEQLGFGYSDLMSQLC